MNWGILDYLYNDGEKANPMETVKTQIGKQNKKYSAFRRLPNPQIGDNLRVRKTDGAGAITNYLYDGLQVLAETDGAGAVKRLYNPGISVTDDKGNKFFYLHDGHGNVADLIDKDGNIVDAYSYDAFGKTLGVSKNVNGSRYVGGLDVFSDDDVGLQYMWNRWYDPDLGRFISRDPIGFAGGLNLYGYVGNNPTTYSDPTGLFLSNWHFIITLAAALSSGEGFNSFALAWRSVTADFDPNSQDTDAPNTNKHGMAGTVPGQDQPQTPQQAIAGTQAFITDAINSGDVGAAVHAAEDIAAAGHSGQVWTGHVSASHFVGDAFPSPNAVINAFKNARNAIKQSQKSKGCK